MKKKKNFKRQQKPLPQEGGEVRGGNHSQEGGGCKVLEAIGEKGKGVTYGNKKKKVVGTVHNVR